MTFGLMAPVLALCLAKNSPTGSISLMGDLLSGARLAIGVARPTAFFQVVCCGKDTARS